MPAIIDNVEEQPHGEECFCQLCRPVIDLPQPENEEALAEEELAVA